MKANEPCTDDVSNLTQRAIEQARARKARVLDEAELEQVSGGLSALQVPIIYGLIFPDDILKQSPLAINAAVVR
jgi:hypothetical protein